MRRCFRVAKRLTQIAAGEFHPGEGSMKRALITGINGITGQDDTYLAELLPGKDCEVHGSRRRTGELCRAAVVRMQEELRAAERDQLLQRHDYGSFNHHE